MASFVAKIIAGVFRNARFWREDRGNVHVIVTLALVPIIGALGMAAEGANWWLVQRAAQNAADTAALSASWNGGTTAVGSGSASSYATTNCNPTTGTPGAFDCEAVGAAAQGNFVNGSSNTVVYPQYLTNATTPACPHSLTSCYRVTVTRALPVYLLGLALNGRSTQNVQAVAYAALVTSGTSPDCLFALYNPGSSGDAITAKGVPKANLGGCDIQVGSSNSTGLANATCDGHNLGADAVFTTGTNDGCGKSQVSNAAAVSDPYASLASHIPSASNDPCGTHQPSDYPQESLLPKNGTLPSSNIVGNGSGLVKHGTVTVANMSSWGATQSFCGDVQLSSPISITTNTTMIIYNGMLDLNGMAAPSGSGAAIQTASGASLTIIFAGSNTVTSTDLKTTITPNHNFTTDSLIDIAAPTSGTLSGIGIYQAPNLTSNVSVSASGNSTFLDLSGVIYQPHADDEFKGAVGKASNGYSCFVWVFNTLTLKGTGNIFQGTQSQCSQAGVTQVQSGTPVHELVG